MTVATNNFFSNVLAGRNAPNQLAESLPDARPDGRSYERAGPDSGLRSAYMESNEGHDQALIVTAHEEMAAEAGITTDFPALDVLKEAQEHFDSIHYGISDTHQLPFSRQLKKSTADLFPRDAALYAEASQTQDAVTHFYALMRLVTFLLFAAVLTLQVMIFSLPLESAFFSGFYSSALSELAQNWLVASVAILVVGAVGAIFRYTVRSAFFYFMEVRAERFSFKMFKRIDDIVTEVTVACSRTRDRVGKGGEWSKRAKCWVIIALWNAKRAEYLDRYATTVIWCVRTYNRLALIFFSVLKVSALVTAFAVVWSNFAIIGAGAAAPNTVANVVFSVFLIIQGMTVWHFLGQKPPDFWTKAFRKSASQVEDGLEHYASKVGSVVENLVHEVLNKEFGTSSQTRSTGMKD